MLILEPRIRPRLCVRGRLRLGLHVIELKHRILGRTAFDEVAIAIILFQRKFAHAIGAERLFEFGLHGLVFIAVSFALIFGKQRGVAIPRAGVHLFKRLFVFHQRTELLLGRIDHFDLVRDAPQEGLVDQFTRLEVRREHDLHLAVAIAERTGHQDEHAVGEEEGRRRHRGRADADAEGGGKLDQQRVDHPHVGGRREGSGLLFVMGGTGLWPVVFGVPPKTVGARG